MIKQITLAFIELYIRYLARKHRAIVDLLERFETEYRFYYSKYKWNYLSKDGGNNE